MKAFFIDLFEYHNNMNDKLFELFTKNSEKITGRSMFLISHSLNAHRLWNSRILKTDFAWNNNVYSIEECKSINTTSFSETSRITEEIKFSNKIQYQNLKGDIYSNTVGEILFQIANHYTHHRGQIMADLRQSGIKPFISDYIYFKK